MSKIQLEQFSEDFLEIIRHFQRANRFIVKAYDTPLLPVEAHLLFEVAGSKALSVGNVAEILMVPQARISYVSARLKKKGYASASAAPDSNRTRLLKVTARGRGALREHNRQADTQLSTLAAVLSDQQTLDLSIFLGRLADELEIPPSVTVSGEHPLRPSVRRLTRYFGQLGSNFMQSGISALHWHILSEVATTSGAVYPQTLTEKLSINSQMISQALRRLEEEKYILRRKGGGDRRSRQVLLAAAGKKLLGTIHNNLQNALLPALRKMPKGVIKKGLPQAYRLVGFQSGSVIPHSRPSCTVVDSAEALSEARTFFASIYLGADSQPLYPETLFPTESSPCVCIHIDGRLVLAASAQQKRSADRAGATIAWKFQSVQEMRDSFHALDLFLQSSGLQQCNLVAAREAGELSGLLV